MSPETSPGFFERVAMIIGTIFGESQRRTGGNRFIIQLAKAFGARRWQEHDDRSRFGGAGRARGRRKKSRHRKLPENQNFWQIFRERAPPALRIFTVPSPRPATRVLITNYSIITNVTSNLIYTYDRRRQVYRTREFGELNIEDIRYRIFGNLQI